MSATIKDVTGAATTASVSSQPRQKVLAAAGGSGVATALAALLIWGLEGAGMTIPPQIQAAISTIVVAVVTFYAGYLTPPGASEMTVRTADGTIRSALLAH